MKDEIKEILEFKEDADYKRLSVDEMLILKDYITNLQEENEKLRDLKNNVSDILDNKREIMMHKLMFGMFINYEELLYQIDEEIRKELTGDE